MKKNLIHFTEKKKLNRAVHISGDILLFWGWGGEGDDVVIFRRTMPGAAGTSPGPWAYS